VIVIREVLKCVIVIREVLQYIISIKNNILKNYLKYIKLKIKK